MSSNSSRELALQRRRQMSTSGKAGMGGSKGEKARPTRAPKPTPSAAPARATSSAASRASSESSASSTGAGRSVKARIAATAQATTGSSARAASLARRKAMSTRGKTAASGSDRTRTAPEAKSTPSVDEVKNSGAASASTATEAKSCGCGCKGERKSETRSSSKRPAARRKPAKAIINSSRAHSLARRQAQSSRGKAGTNAGGMTAAQTARAGNPELTSRELAKALRDQRSKNGRGGEKKARPTGKVRPKKETNVGAAQDASWKVGASETASGQTVTGTMVGRSNDVTGNEASTCRSVTGTEYMGADVFRDFCQSEPAANPAKVRVTSTGTGNAVTGNEVGRSSKVTGDEPGTCKNVTGTEYVSAEQGQAFCGSKPKPSPAKVGRSESQGGKGITGAQVGSSAKVTGNENGAGRSLTGDQYLESNNDANAKAQSRAPAKVGQSGTLRGGSVTGTMVGRREKMTGDEAGSCRNITGDDYVGAEQFGKFCDAAPKPSDQKVGVSATLKGKAVSGTMTGPSRKVTGDEPGTCKAVTGTPYAGVDQYQGFCSPEQQQGAEARMKRATRKAGMPMTGQQPGIGGSMTGADKGACETLTGTPYVGADQAAQACPAQAAEPGSPDFPQPLGGATGTESWGEFSVSSPNHASETLSNTATVTGSVNNSGHITGPFGMANGKVTGTEEARFSRSAAPVQEAPTAPEIHGRVKARVSGEGMDAGTRITGDDWDRGDRVTGTEGHTASSRNPTRRGSPGSVMPAAGMARPEETPMPVSKVTGSSGNTDNGSLITYSGGARG